MRRPEEVFVVVRRGSEFLVLHRSPRQGAYWHGVAGALEPGEDWHEAAARELREETGLVAEPVEIAGAYAYSVDEEPRYRGLLPSGTREIVVRTFLVDAPPGWEPQLDWEHDDYRWCTREEAIALLHWPEPRAVMRSLA
ncbi:MAG: NUDIX domain-containing protein [Thermoleophilia bacterium]|nr:NUDIX domain-containing protein [Thermoleophilia bacterium]